MVENCMGMIPLLVLLVMISFLPEMLVVLATRPKRRRTASSHIRFCEYRLRGNREKAVPSEWQFKPRSVFRRRPSILMPPDLSLSGIKGDDHASDEPNCDEGLACVIGLDETSQEG